MYRNSYETVFLTAFLRFVVITSQRVTFFSTVQNDNNFSTKTIKNVFLSILLLKQLCDDLYFESQHLLLVIGRSLIFMQLYSFQLWWPAHTWKQINQHHDFTSRVTLAEALHKILRKAVKKLFNLSSTHLSTDETRAFLCSSLVKVFRKQPSGFYLKWTIISFFNPIQSPTYSFKVKQILFRTFNEKKNYGSVSHH